MRTIICTVCGREVEGFPQRRKCSDCRRTTNRGSTRYLRPGEALPDGEPFRYIASNGYIRWRWHVGPKQYVECYEHRAVVGNPPGMHVHHINRIRTDNRPENLRVLTDSEHRSEHAPHGLVHAASNMYAEGLSTYEIGRRLDRNASTVWRMLRRAGVATRSEDRIAVPKRETPND